MPRTRTPPNGLTKKCSSEHRRGRGISRSEIGKRLPEGPHKRRGGASASCRRQRSSGDARRRLAGAPAQGHRRMARLASPHQRTGAVAGLCNAKSESDLSAAGVRGYAPFQKDMPRKKSRPRSARSASEFRRHRRILFKHDRLVLRHKSLHDAPCKHISDTAEAEHDEVTALLAIETEEGER